MSEVQSNPKTAEVGGVAVDHPVIREYARNMKKQGIKVEEASKILGMPREVVEKLYREAPEK